MAGNLTDKCIFEKGAVDIIVDKIKAKDGYVDTSNDTVTADVLLEGYTAHDAAGNLVTGTAKTGVEVTPKPAATLTVYCHGGSRRYECVYENVNGFLVKMPSSGSFDGETINRTVTDACIGGLVAVGCDSYAGFSDVSGCEAYGNFKNTIDSYSPSMGIFMINSSSCNIKFYSREPA